MARRRTLRSGGRCTDRGARAPRAALLDLPRASVESAGRRHRARSVRRCTRTIGSAAARVARTRRAGSVAGQARRRRPLDRRSLERGARSQHVCAGATRARRNRPRRRAAGMRAGVLVGRRAACARHRLSVVAQGVVVAARARRCAVRGRPGVAQPDAALVAADPECARALDAGGTRFREGLSPVVDADQQRLRRSARSAHRRFVAQRRGRPVRSASRRGRCRSAR